MSYLDNNASTPLDPHVREAMLPWLGVQFGNPSSAHARGRVARAAIDRAREAVAALVGAQPEEVTFTSGATEALHLAIHGIVEARPGRSTLLLSGVEHPAVAEPAERLARRGWRVERFGVDLRGRVDLDALRDRLGRGDVALVAGMWVNNETGILLPVREIAARCRDAGVPYLCDATQAAGRLAAVPDLDAVADVLAISGHKFHAPPGVGALVVRPGVRVVPIVAGGGQERGRRPGTENLPGIVGLGAAAERALAWMRDGGPDRLAAQRDAFEAAVARMAPDRIVVGEAAPRSPNTACIAFPGASAGALLHHLDVAGVQASATSACRAGDPGVMPTALAFGLDPGLRNSVVRFSTSRFTTQAEIDRALAALPDALARATVGQRAICPGAC